MVILCLCVAGFNPFHPFRLLKTDIFMFVIDKCCLLKLFILVCLILGMKLLYAIFYVFYGRPHKRKVDRLNMFKILFINEIDTDCAGLSV